MASCVRNIGTKNYQNLMIDFQVTVENVGDGFLRHSVVVSVCTQLIVHARNTNLKLPADILIGTVPLKQSSGSVSVDPQSQTVSTDQSPSAPPVYQYFGNCDLRYVLLFCYFG